MQALRLDWKRVELIIENCLVEDIGGGDITTELLIPKGAKGKAIILAKEYGVVAGLPIAGRVFKKLNRDMRWKEIKRDGDSVNKNEMLAEIHGSSRAILTGERVALNFLQRLSGIATITSTFVEAVKGLSVKITDTRKTAPGLRIIDKYAVRVGGGYNHRSGLYDGILIKDNHLKALGSISKSVKEIRKRSEKKLEILEIEVETSTIDQVREAISAGVEIIMLDNMPLKTMKRAVRLINKRAKVEASGGITLKNVRRVAETGVDFISIGSLTHSPKALDMGLYLV